MIDAMFEMPSQDEKEFTITHDYAILKLEKINLKMLRSA
jgi:hypothetical protein